MTVTLPALQARLNKIEDDIATCELTIDNLKNRISECGFAMKYLSSKFEHEHGNLGESEKEGRVIKTSAEIQRLMECQKAHKSDKASCKMKLTFLREHYKATHEAQTRLLSNNNRPTFFPGNQNTANQPGQMPLP